MTTREKISITIKGYKTINSMVKGLLPAKAVEGVLTALLPFIGILMSARIINALFEGRELRHVLLLAVLTVVLSFIANLILKAAQRFGSYYDKKFDTVINEPLNEKIRTMDYELVEDTKVQDHREKILLLQNTNGLGLRTLKWQFSRSISGLFRMVFSVSLVVAALLATGPRDGFWGFVFHPLSAVFVVAVIVIASLLDVFFVRAIVKGMTPLWGEIQQAYRLRSYFYNYVMQYKVGKDIKIYGMKEVLKNEFEKNGEQVRQISNKATKLTMKIDSLSVVTALTGYAVLYAYVALKALFGGFGPGNIVQYIGALAQFNKGLVELLDMSAMIVMNADSLKLFYDFIEMPDIKTSGTLTTEKRSDNEYEIEFRNVSFKYPSSDVYALKNLNLKFNIGKRMAVVGQNGSGKTTMIKLLCRLYDPTEGVITLNGVDIKKYNYKQYMDIFSVVFQDFKLFSFPLGQNVAAGVSIDKELAEQCLTRAGFAERISKMPKGLDTPVYKDFEESGIEISGGEAQKIALARALYKDAPFIVLDEPTAALDPISEFEIYSKFNEIVGDKTTIYISHRLSSCRFCNDIAVFHEGRLIQRGSHDTLLEDSRGKYHELWHSQAQYYKT